MLRSVLIYCATAVDFSPCHSKNLNDKAFFLIPAFSQAVKHLRENSPAALLHSSSATTMSSPHLFCVPKTGRSDSYGYQICKKHNDGRGCVADTHCKKSHVCDVLTSKYSVCGSTEHSRYFHDSIIYGWLPAYRDDVDARAFWEYNGSPKPDDPERRDPAPLPPGAPDVKEEKSEDEEEQHYWTKDHFDDLYYWDRNLRAILYDAAKKAGDSQILKCPAKDCNWSFKLFSTSAVPPEASFKQHLEAKTEDPEHPDWDQLQLISDAPAGLLSQSEMICPRCKSSSSDSGRGQKRPYPDHPPPGSSAASKGSTAKPKSRSH